MRSHPDFFLSLYQITGYLCVLILALSSSGRAETNSSNSTFSLSHSAAVTTGTVSILGSKTETTSHGPVSVSLPKFNPALGTLTGASVTVTSTTGTAGVKNTGLLSLLSGGSYSRTLKVDLSSGGLTRTSQETLVTTGGSLLTLLGLGGTQEAGGPMLSTAFVINQTSDLAALTGAGDLSLSFSATNTLTIYTLASIFNGAGYSVSGLYAGNVSVTYTYTPPAVAPSIISQPGPAGIEVGNTVTLTVVANGTAPLSYQWRKNGSPINGATQSSFTLANPQLSDAGTYSVIVSNSAGSITSADAALTVSPVVTAPTLSAQPLAQSTTVGNSVTFSVTANANNGTLSYQWRKNGSPINGATQSTFTLASPQLSDAGTRSSFPIVLAPSPVRMRLSRFLPSSRHPHFLLNPSLSPRR